MSVEHELLVHDAVVRPIGGVRFVGRISTQAARSRRRLQASPSYLLALVDYPGSYRSEGQPRVPFAAGDLVFVRPGNSYAYGPTRGGSWSETYIAFDGAIFDAILNADDQSFRSPVLRAGPKSKSLIDEIVASPTPYKMTSLLVELLLELHHVHETWIVDAKRLLADERNAHATLADIATRLGLSEQVFRKRFANAVGVPPVRFRTRARLDSAKRLLGGTRLTNRDIAKSLGFSDEFHFSKAFTGHFGVSPTQFRRTASEPAQR